MDKSEIGRSDTGPTMTRRGLMKKVGVTAGAAATYGGASSLDLDPVGEADALVVTGGVLLAGASAGAGVTLIAYDAFGPDGGGDEDDPVQDFLYQTGVSVAQGREPFVEEMEAHYVDESEDNNLSDPQSTPYANAAWQEVRAATVDAFVNDETEGEAQTSATEALDKQTTRSVINVVERWNAGLNGLIEPVMADYNDNDSVDYFQVDIGSVQYPASGDLSSTDVSGWESVDSGVTSSPNALFWEFPIDDLPTDPTSLDDREDPLMVLATTGNNANSGKGMEAAIWSTGSPIISASAINVEHSDLDTRTVLDGELHSRVVQSIQTAYTDISNDVSTYVTNVYQQLEEDAIDPSQIYSSEEIVEEFSGSDKQSRLAAEMLAIGGDVPEGTGFEVEISHPNIQSESLWGYLYPKFSSSWEGEVAPGVTIASSDYQVAYFGWYSENSGEFETRVLSGSEDLQILDATGLENESDVSEESRGTSANANSDVVVYEGEDPPDPIASPGDHSGWSIVIRGSSATSSHSPADVTQDGTTYTITGTSLAAEETVESVSLVPPLDYSQPVQHVSDATNPDEGETAARIEELNSAVENIRDMQNGGSGGFGLPSLGLGVPDWMVYGGAALVGLFAWSKANEDDGY